MARGLLGIRILKSFHFDDGGKLRLTLFGVYFSMCPNVMAKEHLPSAL